MENYININGQKVELTDEQVAQMRNILSLNTANDIEQTVELSTVAAGKTCSIDKFDFIVLEHFGDMTVVILKDGYGGVTEFGKNNNYNGSRARTRCNAFYKELITLIGKDNIIEHTVDLTALDGMRDYGKLQSFASPLSLDYYRHYTDMLDEYPLDESWFLATPFTTPAREDVLADLVCCVTTDNTVDWCAYDYPCAIRPFCVLKSSVAVTLNEDPEEDLDDED